MVGGNAGRGQFIALLGEGHRASCIPEIKSLWNSCQGASVWGALTSCRKVASISSMDANA